MIKPLFESLYQISQKNNYRINDFLSLSCLPEDVIKIVVNLSHDESINQQQQQQQQRCNNFDRQQFFTAVRLIQLYQNRVTVKNNLLKVADNIHLIPPSFVGIYGTTSRKIKTEENDEESTRHTTLYRYDDDRENNDRGSIETNVLHYDDQSITYKNLDDEIKKVKKELHTVEEKLEAEIKENFQLRLKQKSKFTSKSRRRQVQCDQTTKKILNIRDEIHRVRSDDGKMIIEINKMLGEMSENQNLPSVIDKFSTLESKYKKDRTINHQLHQDRTLFPLRKTKSSASLKPIYRNKYNHKERRKDATDELAEVILNDYKERGSHLQNLNSSQYEACPLPYQSQKREIVFRKNFVNSINSPPLIKFVGPAGSKSPGDIELNIVKEREVCDDISEITDPIYPKQIAKDKRRLLLVKTKSESSMNTIKNMFFE